MNLVNTVRIMFVILIAFELLNVTKVITLNTQYTWLGLLITALAALTMVEAGAWRYYQLKGKHLHWSLWLVVLLALGVDAVGDFFYLYDRYAWWDRLVHFGVSATSCLLIFLVAMAFQSKRLLLLRLISGGLPSLALYLAATTTMTLSALYEIEEYTEDLIFKSNRLGPGVDTADDLLFNFMGVLSIILLIGIYYFLTKKSYKILTKGLD